jgi:hypothetical protein
MREGITTRALIAGTIGAGAIGGGAAYENLMVSGSTMNFDYSMGAALFFFAVVTLVLNPAVRLVRASWAFSRSELAVVYIMAAVGCVLPTNGLVGNVIPAISGGIYYATPENNWQEVIIPHLKPWLLVEDQEGIKGFYEGLSKGWAIPWGIWLRPLSVWAVLLAGFFGSIIALMSLLRRQWVESERLLYPLAQVPIAMIGEEGERRLGGVAAVFRQIPFWLGVSVPLTLYSVKALHNYNPIFPLGLPTFIHVGFAHDSVVIPVGINWAGIGFGYLLTTKLSFSIFFIAVLTIIEEVAFMRLGLFSGEQLLHNTSPSVYPAYQGVGAMLTFAVLMLWTSRRYLRQVSESAWRGGPREEGDIMSHRSAFVLLGVSVLVMAAWLVAAGLQVSVVVLFLALLFLMMLGITRVVVEGGLAVSRIPIVPGDIVIAAVGSHSLGAASVGALGMTFPWGGEMRTTAMSAIAHGLKLAQTSIEGQRHRLLIGVVAAIVASLLCAVATMLYMGYHYGAINLSASWFFGTGAGSRIFDFIGYHINQDSSTRWGSMGFVGLGAAMQALLTVAYQRLAWWPIHPLAFPIGAVWCTHQLIGSMFLAWIAKLATLHYGGVRLYAAVKPFFIGLIMGQYLTGGLWLVVDWFAGKQANYLFFW